MSLRDALLAIVLVLLGLAAFGLHRDLGFLPLLVWLAIIALALAVRRRRYGNPEREPPLAGWQRTGERFTDDPGDTPVEVWFDPATGRRRYVRAENERGSR